jgi:hypothetical protein
MRKIALAVVSVVLMFSFSGCGDNSSTAAPTQTKTVTAAPSQAPEVTDAQFVKFIKQHTDAFDMASESQIVSAAKSVCGIWQSGGTMNDVIEAIVSSGVDAKDGGYLAGAGTQMYCPQYSYKIH